MGQGTGAPVKKEPLTFYLPKDGNVYPWPQIDWLRILLKFLRFQMSVPSIGSIAGFQDQGSQPEGDGVAGGRNEKPSSKKVLSRVISTTASTLARPSENL